MTVNSANNRNVGSVGHQTSAPAPTSPNTLLGRSKTLASGIGDLGGNSALNTLSSVSLSSAPRQSSLPTRGGPGSKMETASKVLGTVAGVANTVSSFVPLPPQAQIGVAAVNLLAAGVNAAQDWRTGAISGKQALMQTGVAAADSAVQVAMARTALPGSGAGNEATKLATAKKP